MRDSSLMPWSKNSFSLTHPIPGEAPRLSLSITFLFQSEQLARVHVDRSDGGMSGRFVGGSCAQRSELEAWLERYVAGQPEGAPVGGLSKGFTQRVLEVVRTIPFGETLSYGEVARRAGSPDGARAVGGACHRNPFPLLIPCHRVIGGDGSLGGYAFDLEIKRELLAFEKSFELPL